VIIQILSAYLGQPPLGAEQQAVLEALEQLKPPSARPKWQEWLAGWKTPPDKEQGEKPDKTKAAG
jgi:hypothetical protein